MLEREKPQFHDNMTAAEISAALDALEVPGRSEDVVAARVFTATPCSEPKLLAHGAIRYELRFPAGRDVQEVLSELLGPEDSKQLIAAWGGMNVQICGPVPEMSVAVFFPNSNGKDRKTQKADFKRAGLVMFADDVEMTLVCAALVQKARDAGIDLIRWQGTDTLSNEELVLLSKLRDGAIRTRSGALFLNPDGLSVDNYYGLGNPFLRAAAAPLAVAPESRTWFSRLFGN